MHRILLHLLLAITVAGALACDEEQVLYTTKSKETIPPVSSSIPQPSGPSAADPHAGLAGIAPEAGTPKVVDYSSFSLKEKTESFEWAGVKFSIPSRFQPMPTSGAMRIAQFAIANSGDASKPSIDMVVFFFGKNQGGSVSENVARWARQFTPTSGKTTPVTQLEHGHVNGLEITRVVMEGTYSPGAMNPGEQKPEPHADYGLDAFIVEGGPEGSLYIRFTGATELLKAETDTISAIIGTATSVANSPARSTAMPPTTHSEKETTDGIPGLDFTAPAEWVKQTPASSMRAAQYEIPGGAEFVAFYFGPTGGGSVDDNFNRWLAQIKSDNDAFVPAKSHVTMNGLEVNSVYTEGTYAPTAMGPGAPKPEPKSGQGLLGIVIEGGTKGTVYIRITGPAAVVRDARKAIDESVIPSLKPKP